MERGPSDKAIRSAVYTKLIANIYTQRTHTDWMGGKGSNHEHLYNCLLNFQTVGQEYIILCEVTDREGNSKSFLNV